MMCKYTPEIKATKEKKKAVKKEDFKTESIKADRKENGNHRPVSKNHVSI
jgi:hypothetical protein